MDVKTYIAIVSPLLSALIAIFVARVTFQYSLRKDRLHWILQQRSAVYVDLLCEADAEREWLRYTLSDSQVKNEFKFEDHRMSGPERRKLGARMNAYGSREVIRLHNAIEREGFFGLFGYHPDRDPLMSEPRAVMIHIDLAFGALQERIRHELAPNSQET